MDARTERVVDRVNGRLERAGVIVRDGAGELQGTFTSKDAPGPALTFTGMDIDQPSVREWADYVADTAADMLVLAARKQGAVPESMLRALLGGSVYQAILFGWELAQEDPDAAA